MKKRHRKPPSLQTLLTALTALSSTVYAEIPLGLVGGTEGSDAYAAFVDSNGILTPIAGLPAPGFINTVALNSSGLGIIGGKNGSTFDAYAAIVSSDGVFVPISFGLGNAQINYSAINDSNLSLIGGEDAGSGFFAAYLSSDGTTVHSFDVDNFGYDELNALAMNSSGVGLIGGEGYTTNPYALATYLYPDGTSVEFPDELAEFGFIHAVAINDASTGLVGGMNGSSSAYAALITPDKDITVLSLPGGNGDITATAINTSGLGLIAGQANSTAAVYVAYVQPNGTVTSVYDFEVPGKPLSASLNDSGAGVVGGEGPYAALVYPNTDPLDLTLPMDVSIIKDVAINSEGIAMLGGQIGSDGYVALVAPNGTLTQLETSSSMINSVALLQTIADEAVPDSAGSYGSAAYTQLTALSTLDARFLQKNKLWSRHKTVPSEVVYNDTIVSDDLLCQSPKARSIPKKAELATKPNSIWFEPFGDYTHLGSQDTIPSYSNTLGGGLLGYDYEGSNYLVGAALGYVFNYIAYGQSLGHGKLQEEMLSVYGSYYAEHFWINVSLWGGVYQLNTTRHTLSQITSLGSTHGWLLTPHIGMASPWQIGTEEKYYIEPFFALDWINNWQNAYTETGASGLNLQMPSLYNSLLQSEVGLRFYERIMCSWGEVRLEEKLSYVNQAPFNVDPVMTSFVASPSSFPVAVGSSEVLSMGAFQILTCFVPNNSSSYGGFSFQATAGSSYQSYYGSLFYGVNF